MPRSRSKPGSSSPEVPAYVLPVTQLEGHGTARSSAACRPCPAEGRAASRPWVPLGSLSIPPLLDICSLGRSPQVSTGTRSLARCSQEAPGGGGAQRGQPWEVGSVWAFQVQPSMSQGLKYRVGQAPGSGSCLPLGPSPRVPRGPWMGEHRPKKHQHYHLSEAVRRKRCP